MSSKRYTRKAINREIRRAILTHQFWQEGGTVVSVPGAEYDYREHSHGSNIVIHGGRKKGVGCFLLLLGSDGDARLQGLKQDDDCSLTPGGTGRHMVEAAVKLARERGMTSLTFDDRSRKILPSGAFFSLANMYFLCYGVTWYESIIPGLRPLESVEKISVWREHAKHNRWLDVEHELRRRGVHIPITIPSDIDPAEIGSAMNVLRAIKDVRTDFFSKYEDEILSASFIGNLYSKTWSVHL